MIVELVRNILQLFAQYVDDVELYNIAFTVLCICIPVICIGALCAMIVSFVRGWFGNGR